MNNIGADVYVSGNSESDPNPFSFDMSFRNITSINLSTHDILALNATDGYSVAMYVPAIDEVTNNLLQLSIVVKFAVGEATRLIIAGGLITSILTSI